MKDFRKLKVWEKAHQLVLSLYGATRKFPVDEQYGLTSQIRRSAVSIPSNIAEGCCRTGDVEFARFPRIALGSASELEYKLLLSKDLGYIQNDEYSKYLESVTEIKQMLTSLILRLRGDHIESPKSGSVGSSRPPKLTADS